MNKITDVANNNLITTITASEVIKTECQTCVSWAMTLKTRNYAHKVCVFRMILTINSHHSQNSINWLVFVLTLIFFEVGSEVFGEMIHSKCQIGLDISHFI